MNENMMKNEVKYLREHLREIYQYKSSMKDLTYDMPLELLSRCCIAFDYLQQELQRKDNIINELKVYSQMNINATCNMNNDNYNEGRYNAYCDILDEIKELEDS